MFIFPSERNMLGQRFDAGISEATRAFRPCCVRRGMSCALTEAFRLARLRQYDKWKHREAPTISAARRRHHQQRRSASIGALVSNDIARRISIRRRCAMPHRDMAPDHQIAAILPAERAFYRRRENASRQVQHEDEPRRIFDTVPLMIRQREPAGVAFLGMAK